MIALQYGYYYTVFILWKCSIAEIVRTLYTDKHPSIFCILWFLIITASRDRANRYLKKTIDFCVAMFTFLCCSFSRMWNCVFHFLSVSFFRIQAFLGYIEGCKMFQFGVWPGKINTFERRPNTSLCWPATWLRTSLPFFCTASSDVREASTPHHFIYVEPYIEIPFGGDIF